MENRSAKRSLFTLALVSILSGVIWRVELEHHGWAGLTWISYFHLAIPIGYLLFLSWANMLFDLTLRRRIWVNLVAVIYGVVIYHGVGISLSYLFATGPSAFLRLMDKPYWLYQMQQFSILLVLPLIPTGVYFILKWSNIKVARKYLWWSILGMYLSVPIAILLLDLVNHKGGANAIHSIKSGFLIPLWIMSIGFLFLRKEEYID